MTNGEPQDAARPDQPAPGDAAPPGQGPPSAPAGPPGPPQPAPGGPEMPAGGPQPPPGQDQDEAAAMAAHWPAWRRKSAPDPWEVWMHRAEHTAMGHVPGIPVPAWLRSTRGEHRWPINLSVIVAIVLQLLLSPQFIEPFPRYVMPVLEGALLIGLTIADPVRVERGGTAIRVATILQIVLITIANSASAALLIRAILDGQVGNHATRLLSTGASIWVTNVIAFGLWYWEFDRGGPIARTQGTKRHPDLMFPQMVSPELAPPDWEPQFVDYLYLSFTNATAFSPTDVMPLARWAKLAMAVQSAVSLALAALVVARAVNILKT
jgi:uncharacterized membrane protein